MASWSDIKHLDYYANYQLEDDEVPLSQYQLSGDVSAKLQSGEIVTPAVLAKLQRTKGEGPRDPSLKAVAPFPPKRTKEEIFDAKKFQQKDQYARKALPHPLETPDSFAQRLFRLSHSNLDKVRAAFCFVCEADVDRLTQEQEESELYTMIREMRANRNQTVVFAVLMEYGGVPYHVIKGLKKGAGYEPGKKLDGGGPWFACYVEGEWRFVDAHWGSQALAGYDAGNFQEITDAGDVTGGGQQSGKLQYQCDEFFFLTDPVKLVNTHLPRDEDKQWQLLARPLTLQEFTQMPFFFGGNLAAAENFHLAPASHPLNVIPAAPGNIEIFLQELSGEQYEYKTKLEIHNKSVTEEAKQAIKDTANVNGYLARPIRMSSSELKFKFVPPCRGQFKLTIQLTMLEDKGDHYLKHTFTYVSYSIHCPQAAQNVQQQPQGELDEFGAGAKVAASGLQAQECGEMKAEDGEQQLVVKEQDGKRHDLRCRVSGPDAEVPQNNILLWRHSTDNHFIFLAPDSGSYAMVVYDNDKPICQYLVDAASEARDGGLPLPDWNKLGGLGAIDEELAKVIQPVSHETPYIVCDEAELEVMLRLTVQVEVRAQLLHLQADGAEQQVDGFALVNGSSQGANVDVRFQQAGHYVLQLSARLAEQQEWRPCYNFFVRALGQLDGTAPEFPLASAAWSSANRVVMPKQRLLPINQSVKFRLHIRDISIRFVYVVNVTKDEKVGLVADADGVWTGELKGYRPSAGGDVIVIGGPDRDSCEELLRYRFASPSDTEQQEQRRKEAEEWNRKREENEQRRKRKQENHGLQERGQETLPEDPVEEERQRQLQEEQRKQQQEEERQKKKEEEKARKQREEEERKERKKQEAQEAEEKKKKEAAERQKRDEEERQRKEEEKRQQQEDEKRQRQEKQKQKEEKERRRREDEKKKKLQAKEYYMDKLKKQEEEKKKKKEEKKQRKEEKKRKEREEKEKKKKQAEVKKKSESLAKQLSKGKIDEASLKSTIKEIRSAGTQSQEDEELVAYGERYLDMSELRRELAQENKKAEKSNDTKKLQQLLDKIEKEKFSNGLMEKMKPEMDKAKQLLQEQRSLQREPQHRMDCDAKAMMELRRYTNPPHSVKVSVQGVLLLLGHYEIETRSWKRSAKLLGNVLKRINNGEPKDPHPAIVARADEILTSVDRQRLAQVSPAAAALLDWAVQEVQKAKSKAKSGSAKPATLEDQRRILGVSLDEHDEYEFEDNGQR